MKLRNVLFGLSLLSMALFFSCEKNDDEKVENINSTEIKITQSNEKVINKILNMGYKKEDIRECPNFYLVQGDIMFSKDISTYKNSNPESDPHARHASTNNLISTDYRVVTVSIDSSIPSSGADDWRSSIISAMNEWTAITGCSIHFVQSYFPNPDIIIKSDNNTLPNNVIASAGFPNNNKAYGEVLINLDFNTNATVSEGSKKYNIAHELGHCIGFRHTNWDINGEGVSSYGANYIPNTPSQDSNSVMNGGTANYSWNGFSSYDVSSVKYLYPNILCNYRLVGADNLCAFDQHNERIDYNVAIMGGEGFVLGTSNWSISNGSLELVSTSNNSCKVRVKSTNTVWPANGIVSVQNGACIKTINVSLNNCIDYTYTD